MYCVYLITWAYLTRRSEDDFAYFVIDTRSNRIFLATWHRIYVSLCRHHVLDRNILAKMSTRAEAKVRGGGSENDWFGATGPEVERNGSKECKEEEEGSSDSRRWGFRWYFFEVSCAKIDITACQSDDSSERKHSSR